MKDYTSLSLGLKCHAFIGLYMTHDCGIYHFVHQVRNNIWQYGGHFVHLSQHFIIILNGKTAFRTFLTQLQ